MGKTSDGFSIIFIPVAVAALVALGAAFYLGTKEAGAPMKIDPNTPTQDTQETQLPSSHSEKYKNEYWGFSFRHPPDYYIEEYPSGVIISNYDTGNDDTRYVQSQNEIYIKIDVAESETETVLPDEAQFFTSIRVNDRDVNLYKITRANPSRGTIHRIVGGFTENGLKYYFSMQQANSNYLEDALALLSSLEIFQRYEYKPSLDEIKEGYRRYENLNWGFAFDYPSDWTFSGFSLWDSYIYNGLAVVNVNLLTYGNDPERELLDNIYNRLSIVCSADGPNSSMYCPIELMSATDFSSTKGAKGYRIQRTWIWEDGFPASERERNTHFVYVFPLQTQQYYAVVFQPAITSWEISDEEIRNVVDSFTYLSQ